MLRFAQSPTGDMNISNLRVAILSYLVAKQKNEPFLIRLEDSNKSKNITGKDSEIMMILEKFALKHDALFHQSEHLNIYQTLAIKLLKEKKAFICKCPNKEEELNSPCLGECKTLKEEEYLELKKSNKKFVIRIKEPKEDIYYPDIIKGEITTSAKEIDSFIILNSDNTPSYDFASAVDDMMSDINFIIEEEKHISNASKQIYIKIVLGYEKDTQYAHIPNIKSSPSIEWLFKEGFIPDAILNYLILLDNPEAPNEIFTLPQAIEWFDLDSIPRLNIKFDIDKLRYINREHLKRLDDKTLSTIFGFADADIGKLAKLYLEECSTIRELEKRINSIFLPKDFSGELGKEMKTIAKTIAKAPYFDKYDEFKNHISIESGIEEDRLLNPLKYLLTAQGDGPELSKIYPFIKSYILEVAS